MRFVLAVGAIPESAGRIRSSTPRAISPLAVLKLALFYYSGWSWTSWLKYGVVGHSDTALILYSILSYTVS